MPELRSSGADRSKEMLPCAAVFYTLAAPAALANGDLRASPLTTERPANWDDARTMEAAQSIVHALRAHPERHGNGLVGQRALSLARLVTAMDGSDDPSDCVPEDPPAEGCDMNGHTCILCRPPLPGRGYDGKYVNSSDILPDGSNRPAKPDYVMRNDCGTARHQLDNMSVVVSDFIGLQEGYPGHTNAWCELNAQVFGANSFANRDFLFQAKSTDVGPGFSFDFVRATASRTARACPCVAARALRRAARGSSLAPQWYCKYSGFLGIEARNAIANGYEATDRLARSVCAELAEDYDITAITTGDFFATYLPAMLSNDNQPTMEQARHIVAWLCAMGGSDGLKGAKSNGCGPDIGYCTVCGCVHTHAHFTYTCMHPDACGRCRLFLTDGATMASAVRLW